MVGLVLRLLWLGFGWLSCGGWVAAVDPGRDAALFFVGFGGGVR